MGSPAIRPPIVKARALYCPNCGGTVQLRGYAHTLTAVCINCLTVLDTSTPAVRILQQAQQKLDRPPTIPLGTRGKFRETLYEAIGFQIRQTQDDDAAIYEWNEYVLFNPYKGFRYLVEYQGHWNFVSTLRFVPLQTTHGGKPAVVAGGRTYVHFQTAMAKTVFVMGEFPWRVQVGEAVRAMDLIAPPYMLSAENTPNELVWSSGEYMTGAQIWQAFQIKDHGPPPAIGIYEDQPNPHRSRVGSAWTLCFWMLMLLISLAAILSSAARNETVFHQKYSFQARSGAEAAFVTPVFELKGHPSDVQIQIQTDLDNNWTYFGLALINSDTSDAFDFGREVSYYHGRDSDGSWVEGRKNDSVVIPSVPPGHYYLRVEPEMDTRSASTIFSSSAVNYELIVRRDVPTYVWYWLAAFLLLIPPIAIWYRAFSFERSRWLESDYGTQTSVSGASRSGDDD
ncbi:MAG TPA: DUF4178 domain-containing protein [Bryobacteraceae bacterium]|nr:DUF4178 domain-containing protein [Bryobacteraceae bacterium]